MKKLRIRKWVKVVGFIGLVVIGSKLMSKETIITETIEVEKPVVITIEKEVIKEVEVEEKVSTPNFTRQVEKDIYNKSIELGLTEKQAMLMIAISRHETGAWTSKAFKEKNNFGGIMWKNATEIKIGAIYCPVGAANDPNGLNKYWVGGVTNFYNSYLKLL